MLEPTGLENWLSDSTCNRFLRLIGAPRRNPSHKYLVKLLRACYARIPFQNLSMLTGPRHPPHQDAIIAMMLRGLGGPCDVNNFFFCALLHKLNFDVGLLPASMHEPDCHIGLIVVFKERIPKNYWVDFGNGFPYLTPLPIIDGASAAHLGFEYGLEIRGATASVWQNILGEQDRIINQAIKLQPVHYSYFDMMRVRHYGESGFGPFLSGVRINRWEVDSGFIMRDNVIWSLPGNRRVADDDKCLRWIEQNFDGRLFAPLYRKSVKIINRR